MSKGKVVLVDFDDTIETKVDGKVVLNENLVNALIAAQKDGAKIIGFTNWFSANYRQGSPSRESILQALKDKGLVLDGMNTTWNFLHVYKLVNERKQPGQSHQDYLDSLNEDARLALLNDFYTTTIRPIEDTYDYKKGPNTTAETNMQQVEAALGNLRVSAKETLGLAEQLPPEYRGGKEEMFRVVFSVLGKDKDYVGFDDKIEVKKVAEALAEREKISVHGFFVGEMKARQQGVIMPENYNYHTAIANPELAKIESPIASIKPVLDALHVHKDPKASDLHEKIALIQEAFDALREKCGTAEIQAAKLAIAQLDVPETKKQIAKLKMSPVMDNLTENLKAAMGRYEGYRCLDVLKNNKDWNEPSCRQMISAINIATAKVLNDGGMQGRAEEAQRLNGVYQKLCSYDQCTPGHKLVFEAKGRLLQQTAISLRAEHESTYRPH